MAKMRDSGVACTLCGAELAVVILFGPDPQNTNQRVMKKIFVCIDCDRADRMTL